MYTKDSPEIDKNHLFQATQLVLFPETEAVQSGQVIHKRNLNVKTEHQQSAHLQQFSPFFLSVI